MGEETLRPLPPRYEVKMGLDEKDLLLLKMLKDQPSTSLQEMRDAIRCHSIATVHNRMIAMQDLGLIEAPPHKKQSRSRKITSKGVDLLLANGIR